MIQPLEDRLMLDIGGVNSLPPTIVVGRTLSAYDVAHVQNNQETLTFTVYNQAAEPITGVLLTDTLAPGVSFTSASQSPDRDGANLAWSLGTIQAYGRASVSVTVSLTTPTPTTLDLGARAYGTLDAGMVTWNTAPATLRATAIDAQLLASTPDANTADPYVQEKAAELNYDPQQIYTFLQTQIGYNSYAGSLRGARGTLWSGAGNSLDDASLGVALMRASGVPARYAEGTLSTSQAQALVLSMFPASAQAVGYLPAGTALSDPANDVQLLLETLDHFWFQFDAGSGMQDADPEFASLSLGQAATTSANSFSEVPDTLRQKTEISLTAETYSQAVGAFAPGVSPFVSTVVLDQTFNDVELVGVPLSVGNLVSGQGIGGAITAATFTYSPYVRLGNGDTPASDELIRGTDYQETYTSFPFGSNVLTGLFLNVTLSGPRSPSQTYEKTLLDRIGAATRQSGGSVSLNLPTTPLPALNGFDIVTLQVSGESQSDSFLHTRAAVLSTTTADDRQLASALAQGGTNAPQASIESLNTLTAEEAIETNSLLGAQFIADSDLVTSGMAPPLFSQVYFDSPRLIATSSSSVLDTAQPSLKLTYGIDLLRDSPRVVVAPNQSAVTAETLRFVHGFSDSAIEGEVLKPLQGGNAASASSALEVFLSGLNNGSADIFATPSDLTNLAVLAISSEAKARITAAVESGTVVIVPTAAVIVDGHPTIAWLEIKPSGDAVAVTEQGTHGASSSSYAAADLIAEDAFAKAAGAASEAVAISTAEGAATDGGLLVIEAAEREALAKGLARELVKEFVIEALDNYRLRLASVTAYHSLKGIVGQSFSRGFTLAFRNRIHWIGGLVHADPPLADMIGQPAPASPFSSEASTKIQPTPVLTSGPVLWDVSVKFVSITGNLDATWGGNTSENFAAVKLSASSSTVAAGGQAIGSGNLTLNASANVQAVISGSNQYHVVGNGNLSFYGPSESSLGVSGNWQSYSATVTGNVSITLTVPAGALTLNGTSLPAGTYTITTNSLSLAGSGVTTAPNFAASASITANGSTVELGPGMNNASVGGNISTFNESTLGNYNGSIVVSGRGGADAVTLNGTAASVLTLAPNPAALLTDQNTAVSFDPGIQTSFADTYTLMAKAPTGWIVTIGNSGQVTVTPAPGTQGGTYPIQVIVRSTTRPDLVTQATVEVTVTPTAPDMTFSVDPDTLFTVPFGGAEIPSAFRATIQNTGPAADTYNLTFSNVPAGWTIVESRTSDTVPAGETGIVGIYLVPSGSQLPPPGTLVSFSITATSTTDPSITKTVNVSFTMPAIQAATVTSNPAGLSTTPGTPSTVTITITNVGNVPYNAALATTTDNGLTVSGFSSPGMIPVGQSVTETATLTPDIGTPLNTTLTAAVNVAPAPAQDVVSVVSVRARAEQAGGSAAAQAGFAIAGERVDVTADVQSAVSQQEQGSASFVVKNAQGQTVFTSTSVPITLGTIGALNTVNLGTFNTTGLAAGTYTANVIIEDGGGQAIVGATGAATLVLSLPVSASVSVDSDNQTPGSVTTTETLNLTSNALVGNVATHGTATSVAVSGTLAYVAGTQDISVVDVSNPADPKVLSTFGASDVNQGGLNLVRLAGDKLIVASQSPAFGNNIKLLVYSLASPNSPSLLGSVAVPYSYLAGVTIEGTTAYLSTSGIGYDASGRVTSQFGDVVAVDFSNPAAPTLGSALYSDLGQPYGHSTNLWQAVPVNGQTMYVASSTSTGANIQTGTGRVLIVHTAAGGALSAAGEIDLPNTVQAIAIAIDGTHALVVGSSGGWNSPFGDPSTLGLSGNVTLTILDISNPTSPAILGSSVVTQNTFAALGASPTQTVQAVDLGNGQFAITGTLSNGQATILCVDASNPSSLSTSNLPASAGANGVAFANGQLFGAAGDGLTLYQATALTLTPVTVTVTVPTNGVSIVPDSFSVAPTSMTTGANNTTLTWNLNLAPGANDEITWQTIVTGLQTDQLQPVVSSTTVQFQTPGQTALTITLPATNIAGVPTPVSVTIPVELAAPGVPAIEGAAIAAQQLGNAGLVTQLNNLGTALTNLVETPSSNVFLSQALASLASLITQVTNDPFLSSYTAGLTTAQTALSAATTPAEIQTAITNLGTALDSLSQAITDYALHGFTFSLASNQALALPGAPTLYTLQLRNTGSQTTTYDFSVSGLPAGVSAQFSQPSITLAPGQSIPQGTTTVTLSLSQSGNALVGGSFTVTATAEGANEITRSAQGQLTLLGESLAVPVVTIAPPFRQPGGQVDVTAKIQSVVNEPHTLSASFTVKDANGNVIYTDPNPHTISVSLTSGLTTVDLGKIDTSGFADGVDTVTVTVTDVSPPGTVAATLATATGQTTLVIGLPVSASITTNPGVLPANIVEGPLNVTTTLTVKAETPFPDPLTLDGQVATTPTATDVAIYASGGKTYAYVSGTNGIDIVDVTDPAHPSDLSTFAASDIVQGGFTKGIVATLGGIDYLIVGTTATLNANQFSLLIYSLATPLAPAKVSSTVFNYEFISDLLVDGTTLLVPTSGIGFFGGGLNDEFGTVLAIDLSNPAAPTLEGELFNNRGTPTGGDTQQFGGMVATDGVVYVASSTETAGGGFTFNPGVGRVLVLDDSNPAHLTVTKEVDLPGTEQAIGIAIQGSQALVISATGGPTGNSANYAQFSGNLVLSLLDISNPSDPQLIGNTLVTAETFATFGTSGQNAGHVSVMSLGNGLYAISGTMDNGAPVLLLVDPTNPDNIVVSATPQPVVGNEMAVLGDILYATSSQGLTTYQIGTIEHTSYTVSVEVPHDANTSVVGGSFNIPPTSITTGATFDTLTWVRQLAFGQDQQTFTWQTQVKNPNAGEVRPITLGTSLSFVAQATPGTLDLPGTSVTAERLVEVLPPSVTMLPGETATFILRLFNPTSAAVRYGLQALIGSDFANNLPDTNQVAGPLVGPGETVDIPFQVTARIGDSPGIYSESVVVFGELPANSNVGTGASDAAPFTVTLAGTPVIATPDSHGVAINLTSIKPSAGPGGAAQYTVQVTNTGSVDDFFSLFINGPGAQNARFSQSNKIEIPPGATREATLTLSPDTFKSPGDYAFTVTATAVLDNAQFSAAADGTLTVLASGPVVFLTPETGSTAPGATYQMKVANSGTVTDTFNLSLTGPAALVASLATHSVTVGPGGAVTIEITTTAADFADAGPLSLTAVATSQSDSAIQGAATTELTVPATQSVTASFNPPTQDLAAPGATSFLLQVNNTGNTEDQYSATVTSTTGPITASLIGLDGQPAQSVPLFILPGLSQGAIRLQVSGASPGQGTVTVTIQSLTDPSESTTVIATVNIASPEQLQVLLTKNTGLSAARGATATIGASQLEASVSGANTPASGILFTVTATPTHGNLLLNGQAVALNGTFTQDDINNGRLAYKATAAGSDSFAFNVTAAGVVGTSGVFLIATSEAALVGTGGFTYTAVVGATPASETVATFTDPNGAEPVGNYAATIDWGDGTSTTAGTISFDSQTQVFTVSGSHAYAEAGTVPIHVTLHHDSAVDITVTSTAQVTPASTGGGTGITRTGVPFSGYEFSPPTAVTVATFTDGNGSLPAADFSASIDWGDGTTSAGSVSLSSGTYKVSGAHEYLDEGHYSVTVHIAQTAGPLSGGATSAIVTTTGTIHEQLLADGTVGTSDQNWIQEIYRDLFNRQAELQGLSFWTAKLDAGMTRSQVAFEIVKVASFEEFQHDTVAALYQKYLGRAPDPAGDNYWADFLYHGGSIEAMSQALVSSPEYYQVRGNGTAEGFLKAAFQDALGRAIDPTALANLGNFLAGGGSAAQVADIIFSSNEYHRVRVNDLFEHFLDRPADPGALAFFAGELDNSLTDEVLITQLVSSDEYYDDVQV